MPSNSATCISSNDQPYKARPTLISVNPGKYIQGLCCYPFMVILDRCNGIGNPLIIHRTKYVFQTKWKM